VAIRNRFGDDAQLTVAFTGEQEFPGTAASNKDPDQPRQRRDILGVFRDAQRMKKDGLCGVDIDCVVGLAFVVLREHLQQFVILESHRPQATMMQ
jgi:hypothetical protein